MPNQIAMSVRIGKINITRKYDIIQSIPKLKLGGDFISGNYFIQQFRFQM